MAETADYFCLLTDAGKALQAKAHSLGVKVVLDVFSTGDGDGECPTPTGTETALLNENWRGEILSKKQDPDNRNIVTIKATIPADVGGFWVREFGVWAQNINDDGTVDPDTHVLFAYGNHADYYKALPTEGQSTVHDISVPMIITNTADVTIQVVKSDYEPTNFLFPTGCILAFAGITTPDGWLWCNGDAVSRSVYAKLFEVIGEKYGAGDGSTTFNLPDFRKKVMEGGETLDDLRYIEAGLPSMIHTHDGEVTAGGHVHEIATVATGGHTHTRGTMDIKGTFTAYQFTGFANKNITATGAFGYTGGSLYGGNQSSADRSAIMTFDASKNWTGETSNNGAHSHTGNTTDNGEHTHELTIAESADSGLYGKSETVQPAACTCNYMIKF